MVLQEETSLSSFIENGGPFATGCALQEFFLDVPHVVVKLENIGGVSLHNQEGQIMESGASLFNVFA